MMTKLQLDLAAAHGCDTPGCDHKNHDGRIYLHQRCHPGAHRSVSYTQGSGVLVVACGKCGAEIASIKVAES